MKRKTRMPVSRSPKAITALVLSLVSPLVCVLVCFGNLLSAGLLNMLAFVLVAWLGLRAKMDIACSRGQLCGERMANVATSLSFGGSVLLIVGGLLVPAVQKVRSAATHLEMQKQLEQLGVAAHKYEAVHGKLPEHVRGQEGKMLLSWRVQLLPFLEEGAALYPKFNLTEPWDGPTNRPLVEQMPQVFAPKGLKNSLPPGQTCYRMFGGKGILPSGRSLTMREIADGTSNTILIVEAGEAAPWTQPEELPLPADPGFPLPKLGFTSRGEFLAVFCDGKVHRLNDRLPLRDYITPKGREKVSPP